MKIVLTTHVFLPEHSAGTEVLTFNTAKELQREGHTVEVVTGFMASPGLKDSQRFDNYVYEDIRVSRFMHNFAPMGGQTNPVEAEYNNLFFANWFRDYLKTFNPDVVHFFHLGLLSASAIDVCHELGIAMIMTPTDFWLICPTYQLRLPDNLTCRGPAPNGVNCVRHMVSNTQRPVVAWAFNLLPDGIVAGMIRILNRGLLDAFWFSPMVSALCARYSFMRERMNRLDRVIVPTHLMEKVLVSNGLSPDKVVFSRYGMRSELHEPHLPDKDGVLRIGFIGGLSEHKGAHILIKAFRMLTAGISVTLNIFGNSNTDPKYFRYLKQLAATDLRIRFCGTFPNKQINKIFAELDVLVVPSIWYENTPLVIYSAQAAGCPVIATNLGGMAEVVEHEKNGLLFESGDSAGLAMAIERLANNRSLLRQLATNAIRPKSISDYVTELLFIYDGVLTKRRGRK